MADAAALEADFWSNLKSDHTVMLGLAGARDGHTQPMYVAFEGESGPLFFYTTKSNTLVEAIKDTPRHRAILTYAAKGHGFFASVHGDLEIDTDPANVDRFWNSEVAAWYEQGKEDPQLCMLRLDTEKATLWKNASSIGAAIESFFGRDPKETHKDDMATVQL